METVVFLYVAGSLVRLIDCSQFLWLLNEADEGFYYKPIYHQDAVMYIDPITRQTFIYATLISCDNNPQIVIALDPDTDKHYVLTRQPVLRATPMLFEPKQAQYAITSNTFSAQEPGIYTNAELKKLLESCFILKNSDTTLKFLEKPSCMTFWLPLNNIQLTFIHPLFETDLIIIMLLLWMLLTLSQCGFFSTFLFLQFVFTFLLPFYDCISNKYRLHEKIALPISISQWSVLTHQKGSLFYITLNVKIVKKRLSTPWWPCWKLFKNLSRKIENNFW